MDEPAIVPIMAGVWMWLAWLGDAVRPRAIENREIGQIAADLALPVQLKDGPKPPAWQAVTCTLIFFFAPLVAAITALIREYSAALIASGAKSRSR